MEQSLLIKAFLHEIWNQQAFDKIDTYLHPDFEDHSLPASYPRGKEGTIQWIKQTGSSFSHLSFIESQVTEDNQCMIRIRMHLVHIGNWRNIEPTQAEIECVGYRHFILKDGKIKAHYALIDGQSIESQIRQKNTSKT
ncbi:hypothetical protein GCM10027036_36970 [Flavihumibacter cheonanensis]|uniref:ester cyclase n=1 Tax=Flavihumibacter cheonanensis TaxID=1442385 RepID=UPI001EF95703|nr:ester cyclase [Flavihumibacter cheonanensis]MCG7753700.1 ester cyclase [Flavihumibacter cheonanensis]